MNPVSTTRSTPPGRRIGWVPVTVSSGISNIALAVIVVSVPFVFKAFVENKKPQPF
jgi:hypothetical protein